MNGSGRSKTSTSTYGCARGAPRPPCGREPPFARRLRRHPQPPFGGAPQRRPDPTPPLPPLSALLCPAAAVRAGPVAHQPQRAAQPLCRPHRRPAKVRAAMAPGVCAWVPAAVAAAAMHGAMGARASHSILPHHAPRARRHRTAAHRRELDVDFGEEWALEWIDVACARRKLVLEVGHAACICLTRARPPGHSLCASAVRPGRLQAASSCSEVGCWHARTQRRPGRGC